jgi:DNA-binding response OmpR family regulator
VEGLGAAFMSKPFDVDALAARVGALLGGGA